MRYTGDNPTKKQRAFDQEGFKNATVTGVKAVENKITGVCTKCDKHASSFTLIFVREEEEEEGEGRGTQC